MPEHGPPQDSQSEEAPGAHPIARLEAVVDKDVEAFSAWFAQEDATFLAMVATRFLEGLISRMEYLRDPAAMRAAAGQKPHARVKVVTTLFDGQGGEVTYESLGGPADDDDGAPETVLLNRIGLLLGARLLETLRD